MCDDSRKKNESKGKYDFCPKPKNKTGPEAIRRFHEGDDRP